MIRAATRDDARALAELEVRAWRWAFGDLVDERDMPTVDGRLERWTARPLDGAWVFDQDGLVVGVVQVGPAPDDPGVGLVRGLFVEPAAQGAGIGGALHDHALAQLRADGLDGAVLWVFAGNGHAREFFGARGWRPDGGRAEGEAGLELRLRRPLTG